MDNLNYLKIKVQHANTGYYRISAQNDKGKEIHSDRWVKLLFSHHAESFYGTFFANKALTANKVIPLNGWQLITLFAKEQFNYLIEWDWDELAQICLAAALPIYEAITEKEWIPDFSAWNNSQLRWILPERVINEFSSSFWEQIVENTSVKDFLYNLFNHALNAYMNQNSGLKDTFTAKLHALQNKDISHQALASYFDEEKWQDWLGLKENDIPFTIGLKLEEPADIDSLWELGVFLRGKEQPDLLIDWHDTANYPESWHSYIQSVVMEQKRWLNLFPWLTGEDGIAKRLTEDEAWAFLTDASETLLSLGVEILLPAWWQAMKNMNVKVKARLKGQSQSHRPSFVGLQALLDYDWRISVNGIDLSEEEFHNIVEEKRRLVYIRGRWIRLDPYFVRQIQDLMKKAEKQGLHVRDLIEQELLDDADDSSDELDNLQQAARIQIELNRQWKQMIRQLQNIKEIPLETMPAGFQGELRHYQLLGMSWLLFLRRCGFGACLADDMGLGSAKRSHTSVA